MKANRIIPWVLIVSAILLIFLWLRSWGTPKSISDAETPVAPPMEVIPPPSGSTFDRYYQAIESGGVSQDGIPSIDAPDFVSIKDAQIFMQPDDWIMIARTPKGIFIAPQEVLVWHEIINMPWNDTENFVFSYCPLTATAMGFKGENLNFGTSGNLLNSNLVMYDRLSNQYWPQMLGRSITGSPPGLELNPHPIHWSTWRDVTALNITGNVLTTNTGFLREYGNDPYGSHELRSSYYFSDAILYPLMNETDEWFSKKIITGLLLGEDHFVTDPIVLQKVGSYTFQWQEETYLIFWDDGLRTSRILTITPYPDLTIESETRTLFSPTASLTWDYDGWPIDHETHLQAPFYYDAFWFSWYAYFPDSVILELENES